MIAKAIEGSIKKAFISKLRLHQGGYDWDGARGIVRKYKPTML